MINEENCSFYLRYLVKITEENGISYDGIPAEFIKYFSIPGLEQALNISFPLPKINWSEVEQYIDSNTFSDFNSLFQGINTKFQDITNKLYASYYFITHNITYNKDRNEYSDHNSVSFDEIISTKKGIKKDYYSIFIELAKRFGLTSKNIRFIKYYDSTTYSNRKNPPGNPKFEDETIFIEINEIPFIINPYEGSETDKYDKKRKICGKFYFLIPYSRFLTAYFPEKKYENFDNFEWSEFKLLNHTNISKEISFESSPFELINAKNGTVTFYFSCLPPLKELEANAKHKGNDNEFHQFSLRNNLTLKCINKNVPNRQFSGKPESKRERYVLRAKFPEKGEWQISIDEGYSDFICFRCIVENPVKIPIEIKGSSKSTVGFSPILPVGGLTEIKNKRIARIRFAIKAKYSKLWIKLFKANKETLKEEGAEVNESDFYCSSFELEFPFEIHSESDDKEERIVEKWILISFPDNGFWMVNIWFPKGGTKYFYGLDYFFDVNGEKKDIESPIFDVPRNRKFSSIVSSKPDEIWAIPDSSFVVVKGLKATFHIFSKKNVSVYFSRSEGDTDLKEISEKPTDKDEIIDREFSVEFSKYGNYSLIIDNSSTWSQKYYVIEKDLPEETQEESSLMNDFKSLIDDEVDNDNDIPSEIKNNVEKMLKNAVSQNHERNEKEKKEKEIREKQEKEEKEKEKSKKMKQREIEDQKAKEMFEIEEKEEQKRRNKLDELEKFERDAKEQREKEGKKVSKSSLSKRDQNQDPKEIETLNKKIANLEKEKENLKNRFEELEKKEKEMKEKFNKEIEKLQNEWYTKDKEFIDKMKENQERRQKENEEFVKQEKSKRKKKIDELLNRLSIIENTMKEGKEKQEKILSLKQEIVDEENDEFVILSSRREKEIKEQEEEETLIKERIKKNQQEQQEENDAFMLEESENSEENNNQIREEKSLPVRINDNKQLVASQDEKRSQSQLNSKEAKSKTCILL